MTTIFLCRRAMKKDGRVLVAETVIPQGNDPHLGKIQDMYILLMNTGGRERTEAEYQALFAKAGFQLNRVVPTESPLSVMEAVQC